MMREGSDAFQEIEFIVVEAVKNDHDVPIYGCCSRGNDTGPCPPQSR